MTWIKIALASLTLFLMIGIIGWHTSVISQASAAPPPVTHFSEPFQIITSTSVITAPSVVTPIISSTSLSTSTFQITLEELGYGEKVVESPWGSTQYTFSLPDNWLVENDSYLDIEFSYFFTELARADEALERVFFGELLIYFDNQLLQVYALDAATLERAHLKLDLPPELFNENPGNRHEIKIELNASLLCNVVHKAQLIIHPESTLILNYYLLSPIPDLVNFPRPFYQRSFEPDQVRFVLPSDPTKTELRLAAILAAKLGDLTSNRLTISTTTDVDWLQTVAGGQAGSENLFVVGQPSRNKVITWLNDNLDLPVSLRRREMALSTQGPTTVMPGDIFSYTITLTNTKPISQSTLSLTDKLPHGTELVKCDPFCTQVGDNEVQWQMVSLLPEEVISFSLTLHLTDTVPLPESGLTLENLAVLSDDVVKLPLNISALTTTVGLASLEAASVTSSVQNDYFFVMQDGQPVFEDDGILQEVISPWDSEKIILLITGASQDAVEKAGQSLSLGNQVPRMQGPVALIQEVRLPTPITETKGIDLTLADLGHSDQTIYGPYSQEVVYRFQVPLGWELTDDAYFDLHFNHSQIIDEQGSILTILLNDSPLADVQLTGENAAAGRLKVALPARHIREGGSNEISIRTSMQLEDDEVCQQFDVKQIWLNISEESLLHLDHRGQDTNLFLMDNLPFPFYHQSKVSDILFVLPPNPDQVELDGLLHLAATLGNYADEAGINPLVFLGEVLDDEILSHHHIIAIGRPSRNPFIQQINNLLPQPFVSGSDEVEHQVGEVILRLPPDIVLGYIQEIGSLWNEKRAILVVTGTTDEGVGWATNVLSRQMGRLKGNLALIRQGEEELSIQSIDTRSLTSGGLASAVPELTSGATVTPTLETISTDSLKTPGTDSNNMPTQATSSSNPIEERNTLPTWVMILVGITVIVVIVIFGVAVRQLRRKRLT